MNNQGWQASASHLLHIGELTRERDELHAALGVNLPPYQEWCHRMIDAGWSQSAKGWVHNSGMGALTVGEAGVYRLVDDTPPPPDEWHGQAPPLPDFLKVLGG